jgi:hypothetical protein
MDYECGDTREQVTGGQRNLQSVQLQLSFAIVITINNEVWWTGLAECGGPESRLVWWVNVWTRQVAAGRNLNDGSLTLHTNFIIT